MIRLSWSQPEDLLPHALVAAELDGVEVGDLRERWIAAGGRGEASVGGASRDAAAPELRELAARLLALVDEREVPAELRQREPDDLAAIAALAPGLHPEPTQASLDRLHGAWLGRAAGCLLGKPVEKVGRPGIRAIARSTGNWPIASYFTAVGLDPAVAAANPWNRRSATNSLAENIDGMPEDDDMNFPLIALDLVERRGEAITTDDVATSWLERLPAGRVFTAERVTYRNLLAGDEPEVAGRRGNPFQDWIGAQIRADVYGWVAPGEPGRAARLAWTDARLTHHRSGLYGAMFVAAAAATAVVAGSVDECIAAGLSVVPPESRYAAAIRYGVDLGRGSLDVEAALDALYAEYGHLHWVHALNNAALVAFALARSAGEFHRAITTVVTGGWDTDSNGATVGAICGALAGAGALPAAWTAPLRNRLTTSVPGFDGIGFDELARRTQNAQLPAFDPYAPRPIDRPYVLALDGPLDTAGADAAKIFAAPADPGAWPAWRHRLHEWRDDARVRSAFHPGAYERATARWASTCNALAIVWLWDERLFDHARQEFTPDAFLDDAVDRYGGLDAVVLWQAYPIIGIDERTQFDFYLDVPGLAEVVAAFQRRDVRVFVDYNPWDTATGDLDQHPRRLASLAAGVGADGVFLDTMSAGGVELRTALAALDPPPVLEGESRVSVERIVDHQASWAQWMADSPVPGVLRAHWYERRHMMHHTRRWNHDHSDELQSSWVNGTGMVVWDAVFGSWVGWNARDASTLRTMRRVQRALADVLLTGEWTPLADGSPAALDAGVYASRFSTPDLTLWTAVNRGPGDYCGAVIDPDAIGDGERPVTWLDLGAGRLLTGGDLSVTVPARGVAAIAAVVGDVPQPLTACLAAAAADPHAVDTTFPARVDVRVSAAVSTGAPPSDAIAVAGGTHRLSITYRRRETGMYDGAPYVDDWKPLPPRLHDAVVEEVVVAVRRCAVAAREVTNGEFADFLAATGYRPLVANRFLRHWVDGQPPAATRPAPVTLVGLDDARAYAAWVGARLPTEFEWQLAAEAAGARFERLTPLVWNWTESEHSDGVTRYAILKGGALHDATTSEWYFDGGPRPPSFSAKLLLAGLGVERSSSVGFRLAWDLSIAPEEGT